VNPPDLLLDSVSVIFFFLLLTGIALFSGRYMARVFSDEISKGNIGRLELWIYRIIGTSPEKEMGWREYAVHLLIFNALGFIVLLFLLLLQGFLPLNPQALPGFSLSVSLNAAVSFMTNTNWQVYSGEVAASYLIQMLGFTVQNFLSAATGLTVAIAVIRGVTRRTSETIGNFWVDLTRAVIFVLLPLAFIAAIFLASQGVIQNLDPYVTVTGLGTSGPQVIAMGPVASQEAIKELGTNGGGFFNANSAHPFENPTPLTNIVEIFLMLLIPAALPFTFGNMSGDRRQGWALYLVMVILFGIAFGTLYTAELVGNPLLHNLGATGISMEGKEVRFSLGGTALFATATTSAACGAVNAMHDSLTPLGGLVPMLLILLGEVVFGGVGAGFYTLLAFVIIAVFIAGLMIGRTPEYLGKKIEVEEMKMAVITVLTPGILILIFTGVAMSLAGIPEALGNPGPHGLSEIVYAFASMSNNNGSAFAGLDSTGLFFTLSGVFAMVLGRFVPVVAVLFLAGSLAQKKAVPPSYGTLQTASPSFIIWLILIVLIVGVLTFFPLFALGPIAEQLLMIGGM
jgi:K+-transporting ATPase ATPase A chain